MRFLILLLFGVQSSDEIDIICANAGMAPNAGRDALC